MDKNAIKSFAIWSRNKLIADISYKAGFLGITNQEIKDPLPQSTESVQFFDIGTRDPYQITGVEIEQRAKLVDGIRSKEKQSDYATAYKSVIEEVAYTWFNRLIAIRFMEVNHYLPTCIRALSSENPAKQEPDLVTYALEADLDYSDEEKEDILKLKQNNQLDQLFRMLFIKQCNELNNILPELFETTNDYTELLLNISFADQEGVVYHLVNDISEDNFNVQKGGQIEIIGWLYQYYNEEPRDEIINIYKRVVTKEDIPAATQLFTTEWVVKYMVDNSLGRYWMERNPASPLKRKLEYFVDPQLTTIPQIPETISPQSLTIFDPCMGSGHILVYAFDLLIEIYRERGYSDSDSAQLIVKHNLYGLDIDLRAYQLAYFAVMMKALSYDRNFLTRSIDPNLAPILESNEFLGSMIQDERTEIVQKPFVKHLIDNFQHAKEIGSLLTSKSEDYQAISANLDSDNSLNQFDLKFNRWHDSIKPFLKSLAKQADIMAGQYSVVCTNPPYLNKMGGKLKDFVVEHYEPFSKDLFSVFIRRNFDYCKPDGYSAFMTPFVWMFIKSYEKLREYIVENKSITTLVQMEYSAFEEATVPICTFVMKNTPDLLPGLYFKLSNFKGGMDVQGRKVLEAIAKPDSDYLYRTHTKSLAGIPGTPIAFWANDAIYKVFRNGAPLGTFLEPKSGVATTDNNRFLRIWHEVEFDRITYSLRSSEEAENIAIKWVPYNKGGARRQWYGNYDYVVDWSPHKANYVLRNPSYYFQEAVTWSLVTSGGFSIRYREPGSVHDVAGMSAFSDESQKLHYVLGLLSTKISDHIFKMLNPTINLQIGDFYRFPVIALEGKRIFDLVSQCIAIAKRDWNSHETAWDFTTHPLVPRSSADTPHTHSTEQAYLAWVEESHRDLTQLKTNEETLNRIFVGAYGLDDVLSPEVDANSITLRNIELQAEVCSLISYAVGCMFGRYSLDVEGLIYAGGEWDNAEYKTFIPDQNNIIPITDEEYFADDIVGYFVDFIKTVYGKDMLEENLDFIANALGTKGRSTREIIRNYFLREFFKDHCQTYKKRPIYWLFDSGRQNGFKALVYLHRYDEDLIGDLRVDYLHRLQRIYESEISNLQSAVDDDRLTGREKTQTRRRQEKLIKQLKETKEYDERIAHLALARTPLDLDDGVKDNYEKIQMDKTGKKYRVLAPIK